MKKINLSQNVLSMKFMRRSQFSVEDKTKVQNPIVPSAVSCGGVTDTTGEQVWSYSQCETYIPGLQSFGGFNPEVEAFNMKSSGKTVTENKVVDNPSVGTEENDDEQEEPVYGSLIATIAKGLLPKKNRNPERNTKSDTNDGKQTQKRKFNESTDGRQPKKSKHSNESPHRQESPGNSQKFRERDRFNHSDRGTNKRGFDSSRKRKFWKPRDE